MSFPLLLMAIVAAFLGAGFFVKANGLPQQLGALVILLIAVVLLVGAAIVSELAHIRRNTKPGPPEN